MEPETRTCAATGTKITTYREPHKSDPEVVNEFVILEGPKVLRDTYGTERIFNR